MTYFGTNAVPSVFILRKNKLLARLNSTNDIQTLVSLIESTLRKSNEKNEKKSIGLDLDLNQTTNITVEEKDRLGPVTTEFEASFDYALFFSWLFVGLFVYHYLEKYQLISKIRQQFSS